MSDNKINIPKDQEEVLDKIEINTHNIPIKTTMNDLKKTKDFIECVLNEFQKKFESSTKENNLVIKHKEIIFKKELFSSLTIPIESIEELKENKKYEIIIDLLNFYNFDSDNSSKFKKNLKNLFTQHLTEKGELLILCDISYLNQIGNDLKQILGKDNKLKILTKLYIVSKVPFLALLTIKKIYMAKENIDILNEKILAYEIYWDLTLTKPISYTLSQMPKTIAYMNEMFQYQKFLGVLHPGKSFSIDVKEIFWSDIIDFSMIICDSNNEEILRQKNCSSIIFGQSHINNYINLNKQANLSLCNQLKVSRLIIIRPNPFNPYAIAQIKDRLSSYINLFQFSECKQKSIPIMMISDENEGVEKVYIDNKVIIREIRQNDNILRQLIFLESPHEVQSEIKITLTSKTKINNNNGKKSVSLNTIERYKKKNFVEILDDNYLSMYYTEVVLNGVFFLNFEKYPEEKKKILVLGAGTGNISYFMEKILLNNVEIDSVEVDEKVTELGKDYFGLNNYKKEKGKKEKDNGTKWYFKEEKSFIEEKNVEKYYDLIIMNIHNTNSRKTRSPPNEYFEGKIMGKINKMLKEDGIYIMYLMSNNYKIHNESINAIKKSFKQILYVDNNDRLNQICFCFKSKNEKNELMKYYLTNAKNLLDKKDIIDLKLIEFSSIQLMNKFKEMNEN